MNIKIICVGKIKEDYLKSAINEYSKRLSKFCSLDIVELSDEKFDIAMSVKELDIIKKKECDKIAFELQKCSNQFVFALDLTGRTYTSTSLSKKIEDIQINGNSTITFIIGGSLGLNDDLLKLCNDKISFSTLTFPHQLIRVFLLEQIFRCFKISKNETYHL